MPCQNVTFPGDLGKLKQLLNDLQDGVTVNDKLPTHNTMGRKGMVNDWSSMLLFAMGEELGLFEHVTPNYEDNHTRTYFLTEAGKELFILVMGEEPRAYTPPEEEFLACTCEVGMNKPGPMCPACLRACERAYAEAHPEEGS